MPLPAAPAQLRILQPVATILGARDSLEAINTEPLPDHAIVQAVSNSQQYQLRKTSTDAPVGDDIVAPAQGGPGRWFKALGTGALNSDQVTNVSNVSGANVSDALDALLTALGLAGLKLAPLLTDADGTLSLTDGSLFVLPAATLTAPRTWTIDRNGLPGTTPGDGSLIYFLCLDTTANTKTITNGGAGGGNPMVVNNSAPIRVYVFIDDGANWNYVDMALVQV
jgi:hypothetical protein